jgi:hypothetical protein
MDYTTLARVKLEAGISEVTDDTILLSLITSASRWLDRELTGRPGPDSDNYLLTETKTNEYLFGQIDKDGNIYVIPHKPVISSVATMSWRPDPLTGWIGVNVAQNMWIDGNRVTAFYAALVQGTRGKVQVQMTYTGGIALTVADIPADILEDVSVMVIRVYRENKTGLTDSMGVAELGTATYTKAVPVRLQEWIQSYKRVVPW